LTRKPVRRFLPLTYRPKIQAVLDGTITQSIRINTDLQVGDSIAFHGWSGKPYHSPWSFRTPYMPVRHAERITVRKDSIYFPNEKVAVIAGDLNYLAALDGIEPATGEELIRVLHAMHGGGTLHGKILRWDPEPVKEPDIIIASKEWKKDSRPVEQVHAVIKEQGEPIHKVLLGRPSPSQDFVQLGAFDKPGTTCEAIKEGFVLVRQKPGVR